MSKDRRRPHHRDATHPTRRSFLQWTTGLAIGGVLGCSHRQSGGDASAGGTGGGSTGGTGGIGGTGGVGPDAATDAAGQDAVDAYRPNPLSVAAVRCSSYDVAAVRSALGSAFDLIGGIRPLVQGKTVTVKPNFTGFQHSNFSAPPSGFPGSVGEVYIPHGAVGVALASLLFEAGARRVRFVESLGTTGETARAVFGIAGYDVNQIDTLGTVEYENTRNLAGRASYAQLAVPGGMLYDYFDVNRAYVDTDVFVSLAKMKQHATAGVTLATKNLFGITPNALYGTDSAQQGENAIGWRLGMHNRQEYPTLRPPGEKTGFETLAPGARVPRIIRDLLAARPVDLSIIDGVKSMRGGEGPWCSDSAPNEPGLLMAGFNPVATDAAAVSIMNIGDPLAATGSAPFDGICSACENHLVLAQQSGLGTADLARIQLLGLTLTEARQFPF